jgi:hypothetical protein
MLDLAIIHRPGLIDGKHDLGRILEAMLYYDRVHLVISAQLFSGLWDQLAPADVATLLGHPGLTSTITPEMASVLNDTRNGITTHLPIAFQLSGRGARPIPDHDDVGLLLNLVEGNPNNNQATRAQITRALKRTKRSRYAKILGGEVEARARFFALAQDPQTLKMFLRGWAEARNKRVNEPTFAQLRIEVIQVDGELLVVASHNLKDIVYGWDGVSEWGEILVDLQEYAIDLYLSSSLSGDIVTTPAIAQVAAARLDLTIQRATRNADQLSAFEEMAFEEAHGFANIFNAGLIDLAEALTIIDQSRKFRVWTRSLAPDANLLAEYHRAISTDTALKRFPTKLIRFALFNFAGIVGDATVLPFSSLGLSAIDTFVVDRLASGWRPNVFVRKLQKSFDNAREREIIS